MTSEDIAGHVRALFCLEIKFFKKSVRLRLKWFELCSVVNVEHYANNSIKYHYQSLLVYEYKYYYTAFIH